MTDIRKGDLVRLTRKGLPERVVQGRVKSLGYGELRWEGPHGVVSDVTQWDVELLDRPIDEALLRGAVEAYRKARNFGTPTEQGHIDGYRPWVTAVINFVNEYNAKESK